MNIRSVVRISAVIGVSAVMAVFLSFKGVSATVPRVNQGVDVNTSGGSPNGVGDQSQLGKAVSQDGRYIVFDSAATNIVSGYSLSGNIEVYVRDRANNTTTLVSVSSGGSPANKDCYVGSISPDGRYVVFTSLATNLTATSVNGMYDHIFIHDMVTGTTRNVDVSSSGAINNSTSSGDPVVTVGGEYVAFYSYDNTLVSPSLTSSRAYVYLKNMTTGTVTLLSRGASGASANNSSLHPSISCEGRYVAFMSQATNLDTTNTANSGYWNVYVVDLLNGVTITNVSPTADDYAGDPNISCDGHYISLRSSATNLTGTTISGGYLQAYLYDLTSNSYDLVSQSSSGSVGNNYVTDTSVANGGRYVVFSSLASNLVSGVNNTTYQVFLRDRQSSSTELLSVNSGGTMANNRSMYASISTNAQYVVYGSWANNLVSSYSGSVYASQTGAVNPY